MKRNTTPLIKEKLMTTKSQVNLKLSSHLKILNKVGKKNSISKNISSQLSQIDMRNTKDQENEKINNPRSFINEKNQTSFFMEKSKQENRKSQKQSIERSNLNSLNGTCSKIIRSFDKYSRQSNNPELQSPFANSNKKQEGLTKYLISKSWQNCENMLSPQVNSKMKKVVTEWIIELSHYMKLKRQTLYHTMWIVERCLQKITDLNAKNLQLLAITALFISTKYEEIYPPYLMVLIQKTTNSYHKRQVIELEQKILIALNFQLTAPNRYTFLNIKINRNCQYLKEYDQLQRNKLKKSINNENSQVYQSNQKRFSDFLHYLLQLTLLKSFPPTYSQKQIADSVLYLASKIMKKQDKSIFQNEDWMYETKIQQISYQIIQLWKQNQHSIVSFLYDCDKWSFVGGLTIIF